MFNENRIGLRETRKILAIPNWNSKSSLSKEKNKTQSAIEERKYDNQIIHNIVNGNKMLPAYPQV